MKEYPWGKGTITRYYFDTANDSDVVIQTVAAGKIVQPLMINAQIHADANAGNRTLACVITDGTNILWASKTASIAANLYGVLRVQFGNGITSTTVGQVQRIDSVNDASVALAVVCPLVYLPAGYTVRIYDSAAVSVNGDDMLIAYQYVEYDA